MLSRTIQHVLGVALLLLVTGCEFTLFTSTTGSCQKGDTPANCANSSGVTPSALEITGDGDFGNADFLQTADITVTVTNAGESAAESLSTAVADGFISVTTTDCGATLAAGATCTVTVRFQSPGQGSFTTALTLNYTVDGQSQSASHAFTASGNSISAGTVDPTYPVRGLNWNEHVVNDGPTVFSASDTACNIGEQWPWSCINGGLKRKVVVTGLESCTGVTAEDALGALNWTCIDSVSPAEIHSVGFKRDKGLADLVNSTSWKPNSVTVSRFGYVGQTTSTATWFTNPVASLPDNSGGADSLVVLDTTDNDGAGPDAAFASGTVFTVDSDRVSQGYLLNGLNEISFVTLNGATLTYGNVGGDNCNSTGSTGAKDLKCLITTGSERWVWLEGNYDGAGDADYVIMSYGGRHNAYRRLFARGAGDLNGASIRVANCNHCFLYQVTGTDSDGMGFELEDNDNTAVVDLKAYSVDTVGVNTPNTLFNIGVNWIVGGTGSNSVVLDNFILSHATLFNSISNGVSTSGVYDTNTVVQTVSTNHLFNGFFDDASTNQYSQIAAAHTDVGLRVASNSANSVFGIGSYASGNNLLVGSSTTTDCDVDGGATAPGITSGCATGTGNTVSGLDLTNAFVGKATADSSNTHATGTEVASSITDWFRFENDFRTWGRDGGAFPSSNNRNRCKNGTTCRIWDVRLSSSDTTLLNRSGDGSSVLSVANGTDCPALVDGNVVATTPWGGSSLTFLINAVEVMEDGVGNDNGLCESNEACTVSRNLGRYQGEGDPTLTSCNFNDGTVTGVTMHIHPTNGS